MRTSVRYRRIHVAAEGRAQVIEIVLGALVLLIVVASLRRWRQARRVGRVDGIGIDEATSFRDQHHVNRRAHDNDPGGPY